MSFRALATQLYQKSGKKTVKLRRMKFERLTILFSGLLFDEENDKNNLVSGNSKDRALPPKMGVALSFCYGVYIDTTRAVLTVRGREGRLHSRIVAPAAGPVAEVHLCPGAAEGDDRGLLVDGLPREEEDGYSALVIPLQHDIMEPRVLFY